MLADPAYAQQFSASSGEVITMSASPLYSYCTFQLYEIDASYTSTNSYQEREGGDVTAYYTAKFQCTQNPPE